jgi:receptor protein-tyrosine kinase
MDTQNHTSLSISADNAERIGDQLMREGKLSATDLTRISAYQEEHHVPFGDAANALGVLSRKEIDIAVAQQFGYPWNPGVGTANPALYALADPFGAKAEALRALRLRLQLTGVGRPDMHPTLAVLSPQRGDGRSTLAANLAVSFAELGLKTLLVDADLRNPSLHTLFGAAIGPGLCSLLAGRSAEYGYINPIPGFSGLCVLPSGPVPPNASELLTRPAFSQFLSTAREHFDLVILDTAPTAVYGDALYAVTASGASSAAIMVARRDHTLVKGLETLTDNLTAVGVPTLGVVFKQA